MAQGVPTQQPVMMTAQPVVQAPVQPVASATIAATPSTAVDSDKIEREWINTAKKVISATKTDPHAQASAVADLMRDYIRKRYGKEVGKAPED
jgi:hypothetical protein